MFTLALEVRALLTFADRGKRGVNNSNKSPYVILERPLNLVGECRAGPFTFLMI